MDAVDENHQRVSVLCQDLFFETEDGVEKFIGDEFCLVDSTAVYETLALIRLFQFLDSLLFLVDDRIALELMRHFPCQFTGSLIVGL